MKAAYIALFFAVLTTATLCADALAGTSGGFYVRTNSSCALQFTYTVAADRVTIGQQYKTSTVQAPSDLPANCSAQNFVFTSFFMGDMLPASDVLVPMFNNDTYPVWNSYFNSTWLAMNNGTGCVLLAQTSKAGVDQYLCSVNYNGVPLYFAVWGTGNFTFDTSSTSNQAWIMNKENYQVLGASTLVYFYNTSFPNITANLWASCNSSSSNISSLSTMVTVSSSTNLSDYLGGMWLGYTLVKRNNATASGDYLSIPSMSNATLFNASSSNNSCWSLGVNWSDILPNLSYCSGGCKVSFVLRDSNFGIYVLETSGVMTMDNSGSGSNNGTNNGGSGNGNGNNNGTNNGNGGNGGAANSASSMVFNACLLLISVVYLACF